MRSQCERSLAVIAGGSLLVSTPCIGGRRWETWCCASNARPDCVRPVAASDGARSISVSLSFGFDQPRTPYFLNQATIWFQASSAASLR